MKLIVTRLIAAVFIVLAAEGLLPPGNMAKSAKRVLAVIETAAVAEPIAELILRMR
ncbi:MAG: hypothetical protein J5772_07980 [Clostridia bacterium]|nr:hypothetical protein [Clostridia bacterium]